MSDRRFLSAAVAVGFIICLPMIVFNQVPGNDSAGIYSRLMLEVGHGNWERSFFHLVPPLFPVAGGIFVALGFGAFTAAKITSALFFALTVFPLYGLVGLAADRVTSRLSVVLFLLCTPLIQYAGDGVLATTKVFFLTLLVYGALRFFQRRDWGGAIITGVAGGGVSLARGEGIVFAGLAIMILVVSLLRPGDETGSRSRHLLQTVVSLGVFLAIIAPWVAYEYRVTGWPVTDSKQGLLLQRLLAPRKRQPRTEPAAAGQAVTEPAPAGLLQLAADRPAAPRNQRRRPAASAEGQLFSKPVNSPVQEILRGIFWPYWLIILPVLGLKLARRKWRFADTYLLGWFLIHTMFFILFLTLTGVIEKRYFVATIPLSLGWVATGLIGCWRRLQAQPATAERRYRRLRIAVHVFAVILAAALLWSGTNHARPERDPAKRRADEATLDIGRWLDEIGRQQVRGDHPRLESAFWEYRNGRQPIVYSVFPAPVLLAKGEWVYPPQRWIAPTLEDLQEFCEKNHLDFLIVDPHLAQQCPFLAGDQLPEYLTVVYDRWHDQQPAYRVLGFKPNLKTEP